MMDYNGYYPVQPGQPPPPPQMINNQHDCNMMGGNAGGGGVQMMPSNGPMISSPAPSTPQSMRQTPGPPPMQHLQQQQQQQQHMLGHHPMNNPQQQHQPPPHPNYHQLPTHPPISHSASPHPSSTPHAQPPPPPRPSTGPSPMHLQSPIHMNGPSPKIQPHGPPMQSQQQSNHMPAAMSGGPPPPPPPHHHHHHHHAPGMPGPPPPHHQPMQQHNHGFSNQPMGHHHPNPHYGQAPMNHHMQQHHPPPPVNHGPPGGQGMLGPPPPPSGYMPSHPMHPMNQERVSPMYQHIPQTEFRIMELNKRLLSRPRSRGPITSPLPVIEYSEETNWWEGFACDFFDDDSTLTLQIPGEDKPIEYSVGRTLIPRFFRSYFDGGVSDLSIKLRNIRETPHGPGSVTLDSLQADIITKNNFRNPATNSYTHVVVHTEGHLSLGFVSNNFDNLLIKSWRFQAHQCHEYIDRSMTSSGLSNAYLVDPVTRFGLTKQTNAFLKMCMIMEPMQDLMAHHRQTKLDPKSCLKQLLHDRYKFKTIEDNRAQPNKRRKRKAPAANAAGATNKRSKANAANVMNGANPMVMNMGMGPNMMSSDGMMGMSLASQEMLVVGEPSMLGADFGDENERRITRLENNQYDSSMDSNQQQPQQQPNMTNQTNQTVDQMNQNNPRNQMSNNSSPNNMPNHIAQSNDHDSSGNNVQSILAYPSHNNGGQPPSTGGGDELANVVENGMNDNSLSGAPNDGVSNCIPTDDTSGASDMNHQMNYVMNGEETTTNHIVKSEMDMHTKQQQQQQQQQQTIAPTQMAESEAR